jgi:dephospho-CoA kinase
MIKIGITGGIGTGKSIVSRIFSALGIPVYDADTRAKWLMNNDPELRKEIISKFGPLSYQENGALDRKYLASVFADENQLKVLNNLVHPAVGRDFETWSGQQSAAYILKEAALLYEAGSWKGLDKIIVVSAPLDLRIERVLKRDPFRSREQVLHIISKQLPDQEKTARADFVINNDGSQLLIPQVLKIHNQIISVFHL